MLPAGGAVAATLLLLVAGGAAAAAAGGGPGGGLGFLQGATGSCGLLLLLMLLLLPTPGMLLLLPTPGMLLLPTPGMLLLLLLLLKPGTVGAGTVPCDDAAPPASEHMAKNNRIFLFFKTQEHFPKTPDLHVCSRPVAGVDSLPGRPERNFQTCVMFVLLNVQEGPPERMPNMLFFTNHAVLANFTPNDGTSWAGCHPNHHPP